MQFFLGETSVTLVGSYDRINIFQKLLQRYSPEFFSYLQKKLLEDDVVFRMLMLSLGEEDSPEQHGNCFFEDGSTNFEGGVGDRVDLANAKILIISSFSPETLASTVDFFVEEKYDLYTFLLGDNCREFKEMYPASVEIEVLNPSTTRISILKTPVLSHFSTSGEKDEETFQGVDPDYYSMCSVRAERFGIHVDSYQNICEGSVLIGRPLKDQNRDVENGDGDSKRKSARKLLQIEEEFENYLQEGRRLRRNIK
jgi:hypothetical protein